jgi:hypothetical protein
MPALASLPQAFEPAIRKNVNLLENFMKYVFLSLLLSASLFGQSNDVAGAIQPVEPSAPPPQTYPLNLFRSAVSVPSGGYYAAAVAVADVDHDGHPDILVANQNGGSLGTVGVLLNHGQDTAFESPVLYSTGAPNPSAIAVADVNKDGKLDIVVTNNALPGSGANNTIGVLRGRGDGTFGRVVLYSLGADLAAAVVAVDVNGDGYPDLITSGADVLLNRGDGTFHRPIHYGTGTGSSVAVSDVNGDGILDLVVGYETSVGVLLGNGDGTFQPETTYPSNGYLVSAVGVNDFNGDGKPDIVLVNSCSDSTCKGWGSLGILLANGGGSFRPVVTYSSYALFSNSLAIADVDGDGLTDVLVGSDCSAAKSHCGIGGSVSPLFGHGDGTFQPYYFYDAPIPVFSIVYADINGGKPDAVFASGQYGVGIMGGERVKTHTTLVGSPNPTVASQAVTFTATVSAAVGVIPDGRQVTFYDSGVQIGTGTTVNGVAKFTTPLAAGNHSMKAYFPMAEAFIPSGAFLTEVVKP